MLYPYAVAMIIVFVLLSVIYLFREYFVYLFYLLGRSHRDIQQTVKDSKEAYKEGLGEEVHGK